MIAVLAEKLDVGMKIAAALSGFDFHGKKITISNIEANKAALDKELKQKGFIPITYQGKEYKITWAKGHLLGLKQAKDYKEEYANWRNIPIPYFPNYEIKVNEQFDWEAKKYTGNADPWTVKQLGIIKNIFDEAEYIISATDDDREGELIFAYIYEYLGMNKPYKKILLDSQTEDGFRKAFAKQIPSSDIKGVEMAGRSRAISDWSTGANVSAKMTLKYGKYLPELKMISIGRVQTYVLNLIVERELAIRKFVSKPFWKVAAEFENKSGEKYAAEHVGGQIEDKAKAQEIMDKVNGKEGEVTKYQTSPMSKEVPLLYNLTTVSIAANNKYGISSNDCLKLCQSLYEKGYTTYPRTDSQCLTSDMQDNVNEVLDMLSSYSDEYKGWIDGVPKNKRNYTKRHFDTKKVDSHFAIIPTNVTPVNMTAEEKKVYDLIAKSLIRIIYKAASGEKTSIITTVEGEDFKSNGTVIIDPQWMVVDAMPKGDENLPKMAMGDKVKGEYELKEGKTVPPSRYTDATLMTALRTASKSLDDEELKKALDESNEGGIGRPSTRGPIIEKVVQRYCTTKGKSIVPTEAAIKLIEILPIDEFKSAEMTAQWEEKLDHVQKGEVSYESFVKEMEENVAKWCSIIDEDKREFEIPVQADTSILDLNCPKCGKPLRKYKWGWACSGYSSDADSCKFALGFTISEAKISEKQLRMLVEKKRTDYINGFKSKDGKSYGCFLILDDEGNLGRTWETGYNCPKCGKPITVGQKGWSCSGWKEGCKFTIWNVTSGKELTTSEKVQLIENGRTSKPVKNLKTKDGEKYDAVLVVGEDGRVFPEKKN